jgi:hypothetical protein
VKSPCLLVLLLRVGAIVMLLALVAVVMPRHCMAWTHEWLGLGKFPDQPIAEYLARSLSGMYAILGAFCWIFAGDSRRYLACIRFLGIIMIVGGLALGFMDWRIGMPASWMIGELLVPPTFGALLLVALRGAEQPVLKNP